MVKMEKQLKCVRLLSLEEICLRRVAVLLWNVSDVLASISNFPCYGYSRDKERKIGDRIKHKMLKLQLPELLTNQMIELVGPMILEVRAWLNSRQGFFWFDISSSTEPYSAKLCWTTAGTINYRKTAEELLRCHNLDVLQRFKLACYYCLEDRISLYWEELPEEKKDSYIRYGNPLSDLTLSWPYSLKGKHPELDHLAYRSNRWTSFNQFAFEKSAKKGNETAAEFFFQKLTREEREVSLMTTAETVVKHFNFPEDKWPPNRLLYLLSLMTPKQQMKIIKKHPIGIFLCFLRSQLQGLFRENAGLLWALFPPSKYIALLETIFNGYPFIFVPEMIEEFFMESPQDFKTCFVDGKISSKSLAVPADHFLRDFFRHNDSESIKVIFQSLDAAIRVKLVRRSICLFYDYMSDGKWQLVELCLREATLSEEAKRRLKVDFTRLLELSGELENPDFKRYFDFLDGTHASFDKRKMGQKRKLENGSPE